MPVTPPPRLALGRLPTPLEPSPRLGAELGLELLWKRDDLSGFELSGNKVRKLEFLLAEAEAQGADTLVTAGGVQSNHCRATAFAAARRGLGCTLLLRTADPARPAAARRQLAPRPAGRGRAPLGRRGRVGAARRADGGASPPSSGAAGRRPYLIPVGGSNALGSWGYLTAVDELRAQLPAGLARPAGHPRGGLRLGRHRRRAGARAGPRRLGRGPAGRLRGLRRRRLLRAGDRRLVEEARDRWPGLPPLRPGSLEIDDRFIGPGYAQATPQGYEIIRRAARRDGILLDHVYTGKAFLGLAARARELGPRVVFLHTGGAFGLLVAGDGLGGVSPGRRRGKSAEKRVAGGAAPGT